MSMIAPGALLCADDDLGYLRGRTSFSAGATLAFDEPYRLAHLPLVAPDHPRVIARRDGAIYDMGRHPQVHSLVLPVPDTLIRQSDSYATLDEEIRNAPFAAKIAWDLVARRRDKLHATVCGSLAIGDAPPIIDAARRSALARLGPIDIELRGLFSGNINLGRLYLKVYPERRDGKNMLQAVQNAMGRKITDLSVVGLYNFTEELDAAETASLAAIIERWWDRPILRFQASAFWLLAARDDLALDSEIVDILPLT